MRYGSSGLGVHKHGYWASIQRLFLACAWWWIDKSVAVSRYDLKLQVESRPHKAAPLISVVRF